MNYNILSQSLIVSGIPFKNKAKESNCWQEAKVLWQIDTSVWMQLAIGQAEQNWILVALSRQRDSGLWTVEATKIVRKTEFTG